MTDEQWNDKLDEIGDGIDKQLEDVKEDDISYFVVVSDSDGYHCQGDMPPEMVIQACVAMVKTAEELLKEEQLSAGPAH